MMKTCTQCGINKPFSEFYKKKANKNGLTPACKICQDVAVKAWAKANPEKYREISRKSICNRRKSDPARHREIGRKSNRKYREDHPERARESVRKWVKDHPVLMNAHYANKRAAKLQRTMKWRNPFAINYIYRLARIFSKDTRILHEVDHVIPLQGKLVSGLHVENNLQILTVTANHSKSNTFMANQTLYMRTSNGN